MNRRASIAFEMARQVAEQSDFTRAHVGCLITYKGIPIASGCNSNKTHPMQEEYNRYRKNKHDPQEFIPKRHAEITALSKIRDLNLDSRKLEVYVYRIRKDQKYGMARPCPSCMQALKDMGVHNINYTTNEGYAEEVID